jgi:hypothetical protein
LKKKQEVFLFFMRAAEPPAVMLGMKGGVP